MQEARLYVNNVADDGTLDVHATLYDAVFFGVLWPVRQPALKANVWQATLYEGKTYA